MADVSLVNTFCSCCPPPVDGLARDDESVVIRRSERSCESCTLGLVPASNFRARWAVDVAISGLRTSLNLVVVAFDTEEVSWW